MNPYTKLLYVLDINPATMSDAWAPIYIAMKLLEALNPPPVEQNIVDEFIRQLTVYAGGRWPWVQAVEQRMNEFRNRV